MVVGQRAVTEKRHLKLPLSTLVEKQFERQKGLVY